MSTVNKMCDYDYDSPDFYSQKIVVAKKNHICEECQRVISSKEKYQYVSGKWDGILSTFKTCQHCVIAQKWLHEQCNGWVFGSVYDDLVEHAFDYKKVSLYRMAVGMRRRWKKFKTDELMKVKEADGNH